MATQASAAVDISHIQPATQQEITNFFNTSSVKMVFSVQVSTESNVLCYVDWSEAASADARPPVHLMTLSHADLPHKPVISPDGQYVTYCGAAKVMSGDRSSLPRSAYVCDLSENPTSHLIHADSGHVPRWIQDDGGTPTVIYATAAYADGDNKFIWQGYGRTVKVPCPGGVPGTKETVYAGGSFLAGLSYDGRYLATAENSPTAFILDLQNPDSGAIPTPLITKTGCDTMNLQYCNSSVSASRYYTNVMAGLTVPGSHSDLGSWGFHDRIFMIDNQGRIVRQYGIPPDPVETSISEITDATPDGAVYDNQWNGAEWSNHPYFLTSAMKLSRVGSASSGGGTKEELLWAVNLKDSLFLQMVGTLDSSVINMPSLWVSTDGFSESSTWLDDPVYTASFKTFEECTTHVDTGDTLTEIDPECKDDGGMCGTGASQCLLLPFGIKATSWWRKRKKKRKVSV